MNRSPFAVALALASQIGQAAQGAPAIAAATALISNVLVGRAHAAAVSAPQVVEDWLLPRYDTLLASDQGAAGGVGGVLQGAFRRRGEGAEGALRGGVRRLVGGGVHHLRPGDAVAAARPLQPVPRAAQRGRPLGGGG